MITRWQPSVAAQVWAMVLACGVLVGGLIALNTAAVLRDDRDQVGRDLVRRGTAIAAYLEADLVADGDIETSLASIGGQPGITGTGPACDAALTALQPSVEPGLLEVVDARGTVRCSSVAANRGKPLYAGQAGLLARIAARKGGLELPIALAGSPEPRVAVGVPLESSVPTSLLYVSSSQDLLVPDDEDGDLETLVVEGSTGTVLMRNPTRPGVVGKPVAETGLARAVTAAGVVSLRGVDDVRRLYRQVAFEELDLVLLVGQDEEEAYAPARAGLRRNAWFGAGLVLVVGLLGLLLHRRVAKPARRLRTAILQVGAGSDDPAPTTGPVELAEIGEAVNEMVAMRRRADGRARAIVQSASDYLLVVDTGGTVTYASPSARSALGVETGDDRSVLMRLLHPDDRSGLLGAFARWREQPSDDLVTQLRTIDAFGLERTLELHAKDLLDDDAVQGLVVTARDITDRIRFEEHLRHQARHDPLTGLPNRAAVLEALAVLQGDPIAVYYLDLDRFKLVNDSHGHTVGDRVLMALGHRLQRAVRPGDVVSRFGGDEFVVVAPGVDSHVEAEDLADRMRHALLEPIAVERRDLFVSGSIGIALATAGDTPEDLLRHADTAMYRAKADGRNRFAVYDEGMRDEALRLLRTETGLHRALEREELVLEYQPQVRLLDGTVYGAEALVRWRHPEHGLVRPDQFIPVAEDTGLIVSIGEWVLREACTWAAGLVSRGAPPLSVSVNVSARQLVQPDFLGLVRASLDESGLTPSLLCLELTETILVTDADTASVTLTALHELGVRISIDDFGTGWSSLTYLRRFPVDEIKIDRSYVGSVPQDPVAGTIVRSVIGMAAALGLSVTAEGIETDEQQAFLLAAGCPDGQGYLHGRPMSADQVEERARAERPGVALSGPTP